jgi:hypothetical protein
MDSTEYYIVRPDHSYALVSNLGSEELELTCVGHWRIEDDDLLIDCAVPAPHGLEKEFNNPTHSYRYRINDFLKDREPHGSISYKSP